MNTLQTKLAELLKRETNGLIISGTLKEHFGEVVELMDAIGAERKGSGTVVDGTGRNCVVDTYILPGGRTIKAGYPNIW